MGPHGGGRTRPRRGQTVGGTGRGGGFRDLTLGGGGGGRGVREQGGIDGGPDGWGGYTH
jgi:hypothetical protein